MLEVSDVTIVMYGTGLSGRISKDVFISRYLGAANEMQSGLFSKLP